MDSRRGVAGGELKMYVKVLGNTSFVDDRPAHDLPKHFDELHHG
jgi:hypothetical protein